MVKSYIETPYGDIFKDIDGLSLEVETDDFSMFSPTTALDNEIDNWLIDNDYMIFERGIYFNDPIVETLNYIYYNEKTSDYEEVEVPVGYNSSDIDMGNFLLKYKLKKR